LDILLEYKRSWIQHVNRMPRNRLPRVMKYYSPTGRRNHEETSGYVRPERANKWPSSMNDMMMMMMMMVTNFHRYKAKVCLTL